MDADGSDLACVYLVRLILLQACLPRTGERERSSSGCAPNYQGAEQPQPSTRATRCSAVWEPARPVYGLGQ